MRDKKFFDLAPDAIFELTPDGIILEANKKALDLLGYNLNEMQHRHISNFLSPVIKINTLNRLQIIKKQKFLTGEILYRKKDGTDIFFSVQSVLTEDNTIVEFLNDVSQWLSIVSVLADSEYKYRRIFETSPLSNEIYTHNFSLEKINESGLQIYGIKNKKELTKWNLMKEVQLSGKNFEKLQRGDIIKFNKVINFDKIKKTYSLKTNREGESHLHISIFKLPAFYKEKNRYYLQVEDLTFIVKNLNTIKNERKNKTKAEKMSLSYLSHLSHEIRTPLNTIIGMSEVLNEMKLDKKEKKYLDIIGRASNYLSSVVNDVLDYSKLESKDFDYSISSFNLKELCQEIMENFETQIKDKKIKSVFDFDKNIPEFIEGDPFRFRQILYNLIGNAVKFTDNGFISLILNKRKLNKREFIEIAVKDTGIGIEKEKIMNIFAPFEQQDYDIYQEYGGTGLGLAICKKITEKLGGEIKVKSKPGVGTEFIVLFPLNIELEKSNKTQKGRKVLIIDDLEENQLIFSTYLKKLGLNCFTAYNGKEGLKLIKENDFFLILLDIQLPETDGYQILEEIRKTEKGKNLKIVALTGRGTANDLKEMDRAGFDAKIIKPVKKASFLKKIQTLLTL
ncbi:MAG: ATP-binding protein [Candidatus Muiribacteriota bacterium]